MDILETIFGLHLIIGFVVTILLLVKFTDKPEEYFISPRFIYDNTKLNIFGVILISLLIFLIATYYYIIIFIYWITHIGRRK